MSDISRGSLSESPAKPNDRKLYLGDGVVVHYDGYHIVLTTGDGVRETNRICLDPDVVQGLLMWMERGDFRYGR